MSPLVIKKDHINITPITTSVFISALQVHAHHHVHQVHHLQAVVVVLAPLHAPPLPAHLALVPLHLHQVLQAVLVHHHHLAHLVAVPVHLLVHAPQVLQVLVPPLVHPLHPHPAVAHALALPQALHPPG